MSGNHLDNFGFKPWSCVLSRINQGLGFLNLQYNTILMWINIKFDDFTSTLGNLD